MLLWVVKRLGGISLVSFLGGVGMVRTGLLGYGQDRHPMPNLSSGVDVSVGAVVLPGGGLVVEGAGLQAAVQDADEPVGQLAQGCVMTDVAGPDRVVVGPGAR